MRYSHAFTVAFSVENDLEDGHDTPLKDLLAGLSKRLNSLRTDEDPIAALEAFECYDSAEVPQ